MTMPSLASVDRFYAPSLINSVTVKMEHFHNSRVFNEFYTLSAFTILRLPLNWRSSKFSNVLVMSAIKNKFGELNI
jgi:hypothetical protein